MADPFHADKLENAARVRRKTTLSLKDVAGRASERLQRSQSHSARPHAAQLPIRHGPAAASQEGQLRQQEVT